jgi:hypothetical protein
LFQSKLYSFLSGKLKDLINTDHFLDGAALQYKNRKNFNNLWYHTEISVWMLSGSPSQCHMAKVDMIGIGGTMKKAKQERQLCKTLMRPCYQDNTISQLL